MKLLSWSLNKRTEDIDSPQWVTDTILAHKPDLVCLVEYKKDLRIVEALFPKYYVFENDSSPNGIMLAVAKDAYEEPRVIYQDALPDKYSINHVIIKVKDGFETNFIGVRMFSPMDAPKQTPSFFTYLTLLSEANQSFICTGDFNILGARMRTWFPGINLEKQGFTEKKEFEKNSIIYTKRNVITGFGDVDHVMASSDLTVFAEYSWKFIENHPDYPHGSEIRCGQAWGVPKGSPDHAIMIAHIERS